MTTQPDQKKTTPSEVDESPTPQMVNKFHTRSDLDSKIWAQHHTLGIKANQASPGDHNHDGSTSRAITAEANPSIFSWGAWTAIPTLTNCAAYAGFDPPEYRVSTMGDYQVRGLLSCTVTNPSLTIPNAAPKYQLLGIIKTQTGFSRFDVSISGANANITFSEPAISPQWFSIQGIYWSTR